MSWSLHVIALHELAHEGMVEWATAATVSRGVPARAPRPLPLPTVDEVLAAFRRARCHGSAWFAVRGVDPALLLPGCPAPARCAGTGGRDLGEVSLQAAGHPDRAEPMPPDAGIEQVSFRKPIGVAVLAAVCELASVAGPQIVFDDSADRVFVVRPGERAEDLMREWPW